MAELLPNDRVAPEVGDIWQEQDPRQPRFVRVAQIGTVSALIYQVERRENGTFSRAAGSVERWAQIKRFNGKRSGYALHQRPDKATK